MVPTVMWIDEVLRVLPRNCPSAAPAPARAPLSRRHDVRPAPTAPPETAGVADLAGAGASYERFEARATPCRDSRIVNEGWSPSARL